MDNEKVVVSRWNPDTQEVIDVVTDLESIIRNPSGFKMDHVGILLFNKERKARGLSEYKLNPKTGTFDEVGE